MTCYHPMEGYRSRIKNKSGKRSIVFNPRYGLLDMPITCPCGQCIGCKLEKSRQWAIRITHEISLYEKNSFITLTYNDKHLPENNTLNKKHFTLFIKRLRRAHPELKIRYYMCGEYGDISKRAHYHAIIFNYNFPDKEPHGISKQQHQLFTSQELQKHWTDSETKESRGFAIIGEANFETSAYVARYCTKKITGSDGDAHYRTINNETGEIHQRTPEYSQMSRKPAIGQKWYQQFKTDIYNFDVMEVRGKKMRPPKYYDTQYEKEFPKEFAKLKKIRQDRAIDNPDNEYDRRLARCKHQEIRSRKLKRQL